MPRFSTSVALLGGFFALSSLAVAQPAPPSFTPAQRAEIVTIVRDALKKDPSILRDAVGSLQADDDAHAKAADAKLVHDKHNALFADSTDPIAGNPHGDVTLVEFYDPRCPYCRRIVGDVANLVAKDPNLRVVYKDYAVLGPPSVLEAKAILAAQKQHAYLAMQKALMSQPAQADDNLIRAQAKSLGLDVTKLFADMNSDEINHKIQANTLLGHDMGVNGTPTFIVGDQILPGAQEISSLTDAIAAVRAQRHKS